MNLTKSIPVFLPILLLTGCASTNTKDPYESFNRKMTTFNEVVDKAVIKPVAQGYDKVVPQVVQTGLDNAFNNLAHPRYMIHDLLQGKPTEFIEHTHRFVVNSTIGLGGFIDLTKPFGLPELKYNDLGMTLTQYGWKKSNYLVLPFLGPGTLRDNLGRLAESGIEPRSFIINLYANTGITLIQIPHYRAKLLDVEDLAKQASLDPYVFMREGFLQYRHNQLYQRGFVDSERLTDFDDDDELSIHDIARARNQKL